MRFTKAIKACDGDVERAFLEYERMVGAGVRPTERTFTDLLSVCGKARSLEGAVRAWHELTQQSMVKPNAYHYTALVSLYGKAKNISKAFSVYNDMIKAGVQPSVYTFSALISACAKARQLDRAFAVYEQMVQAGVQPDVVTFSALISACATSGQDVDRMFPVLAGLDLSGMPFEYRRGGKVYPME
eukprot:gene4934-5073_t